MPKAVALVRKPLPKASPESDPRFSKVKDRLKAGAAKTKAHPPAAKKAAEAAAASKGPPNEKVAGGKAAQVDKIKEAKEGKPEQSSFLAILRAEIEKVMPKNLGQTDNFDQTAQQVKGGLKGNVADQKDKSTKDVSGTAKATPAPAGEAKAGGTVPAEAPPPAPNVGAGEGMPAPKSDADVSLKDSKENVDAQMKEGEVTPQQLQKANDPRFSAVLDAKQQVAQNADAGPGKYRAAEKATLNATVAGASASAKAGAAAMVGVRAGGNAKVLSRQQQQKAKDEAKRKEVTDKIESIYNATKSRVEAKLNALDPEVNGIFDRGVDAALNAMTNFVNAKIRNYKIDRYLSIPLLGLAAWVRDQFKGLPDEVNVFYDQGRQLFQAQMDALIVRVAALVEQRLKEAKAEVAKGQAEIKAYVASQPKELQAVAQQAADSVNDRFKELESGIEEKKNSLAQSLAQKYKEGFDKANEALKKIQDENKGLVQAFAEKLGEVLKALAEFKARLMGIIQKGEETIKLILADPIGFLGNLINAVKGGIQAFVGNIKKHLAEGFKKWLFGNLPPGVEIPSDLSLVSIFKLVLSVLGITYESMRAKAVKLIGERNVKIIEKLVEYITILIRGGPAALWEKVKEDLSSLKDMVIEAIKNYIIETIVKQAVAKIVSMFNPVGAIIQAIMAIYNVVMFVVEKAAQIMEFVESIVNSIHAIATGSIGAAVARVEQALGNAVPILIGFLAQLIGLGGIAQKVRDFIAKVRAKVDAAIDKAIAKVVAFVKKMFGKGGKEEKKGEEGGDVKTQVENELKGKLGTPIAEGGEGKVQSILSEVAGKYKPKGLKLLHVVDGPFADEFEVHAVASPGKKVGLIKTHLGLNPRDLDLSQPSTTLTATFNSRDLGPSRSGAGDHAEDKLKRKVDPNLDEWIKNSKTPNNLLTVNINRSPCGEPTPDEPDNHNCAATIAGLAARGRKIAKKYNKNFDVRLNIASLYGGERSGEDSPSQLALHTLLDANVQIEGWDIVRALERKGVKNINAAAKRPKIKQKLSKRVAAFKKVLRAIKAARAT